MSGSAAHAASGWTGPRKGSRLDAVSGLRAIGALAVLLYHVTSSLELQGTYTRSAWIGQMGRWGVCLFFVLSGYLLYRPFAAAHIDGKPQPNTWVYLLRRALRILPAYWVALTIWLVFYRQPEIDTIGEYVRLYTLTQIYQKGLGLKGLYVAWTLAIEVGFYLLLPLMARVARLLVGRRSSARQRFTAEVAVACLWIFVGVQYRILLVNRLSPIDADFYSGWPMGAFDRFGAGMLIAVLVTWWERRRITPKVVALIQAMPWICWAAGLAALAVVVENTTTRQLGGPIVGPDVGRDLLLALSGFLFALPAMLSRPGQSWMVRVLGGFPLEPLGLVSYGLFLWHPIWIRFFSKLLDEQGYVVTFWPLLGAVVVASTVSAVVSYLLLERWALTSAPLRPAGSAAVAGAAAAVADDGAAAAQDGAAQDGAAAEGDSGVAQTATSPSACP